MYFGSSIGCEINYDKTQLHTYQGICNIPNKPIILLNSNCKVDRGRKGDSCYTINNKESEIDLNHDASTGNFKIVIEKFWSDNTHCVLTGEVEKLKYDSYKIITFNAVNCFEEGDISQSIGGTLQIIP